MPYSSIDELPEGVQALPKHAKEIFMATVNSALKDGKSEESAFKIAWSAVKKAGYTKDENGNWHKTKKSAITELWESVKHLFEPLIVDEETPEVLTNARAMSLRRIYYAVQDELMRLSGEKEQFSELLDVFEDEGEMYALIGQEGKLFRAGISVSEDNVTLGDWRQFVESHPPVKAEGGAERAKLMVMRQADGRYRWVAQAATAILNRVGEIDSTKLFDNFIKRAKEMGQNPTLQFFHMGQATRMGVADFLAREGVVYINSGLFDDTPEAQAAAVTLMNDKEHYWGTSIRYKPEEGPQMIEVSGIRIPVYNDGIHIETSILPERRAAAWFTAIGAMEEVIRMDKALYDDLLKLLGGNKDLADCVAARLDGTNERATSEGMISRDATPPETPADQPAPVETPESQPTPAEPAPVPEPVVAREFVLDESAMTAIAERFTHLLTPVSERLEILGANLNGLAQKGEEVNRAVDERLKALEKDEQDKKREWLHNAPAVRIVAAHVPREANKPAPPEGQPAPTVLASRTIRETVAQRGQEARDGRR